MRGHVRQRGRGWAVVYDEVRGDDGKRVQRWRTGGDTKKEAEETLRTILGTLDSGEYVRPNEQTFGDSSSSGSARRSRRCARRRTRATRMLLRTTSKPRLGNVQLQRLTAPHVERALCGAAREGPLQRQGRPLASDRPLRAHRGPDGARGRGRLEAVTRNVAASANPPKKAQAGAKPTWTAEQLRRSSTRSATIASIRRSCSRRRRDETRRGARARLGRRRSGRGEVDGRAVAGLGRLRR